MSAENEPEQEFSDTSYYNDSATQSDQQSSSPKDLFEDEVKEDCNRKKNRQSKFKNLIIPSVAVLEKIVICIDTSYTKDMTLGYACTHVNKNTIEPRTVMNEALRVFFTNKLAIAKDTMFALVSIKPGNVAVVSDFTSNVQKLVRSLSELKYETIDEGTSDYDLTSLFSKLFLSLKLPEEPHSTVITPDYVVRVIFVYNNSHTIPRLNEIDNFHAKFLHSPYCIFDIVHLHEAQSDFNAVLKIYSQLSKIISPRSYLLECSRNVTLVFETFAKLLAHPYQRVGQGIWEF